jgi:photosystem I subunit PsaN
VAAKPVVRARSVRTAAAADANACRKQALGGLLALSAAIMLQAAPAHADLTSDLLAKSAANKGLHDKQRLATSGANFARTRTVTDGTCAFPTNWVGCENSAETGDVKYLSDDLKLECEGTAEGKICAAKPAGSLPSPFGL